MTFGCDGLHSAVVSVITRRGPFLIVAPIQDPRYVRPWISASSQPRTILPTIEGLRRARRDGGSCPRLHSSFLAVIKTLNRLVHSLGIRGVTLES